MAIAEVDTDIDAQLRARDTMLRRAAIAGSSNDAAVARTATNWALIQRTAERRQAADMLHQSQKLASIGQLAGGIAHDFNNLLAVIIGNTEFLLDVLREGPGQDMAREILNSALSGADLTRRMLAFARCQPLQPRRIDLNALLPSHVAMLQRLLGETIEVATTLAADLWSANADPSQIGDALLNLAFNARDAMPDGGRLTIATENAHLDVANTAAGGEAMVGDYVMLAVIDTGVGMPPEVLERASEPFFSTKPTGAGSGLGLSMVFGFAKQSGGHLAIDSVVGVGTRVRLYLPRAVDVEATQQDMLGTVAPAPGGDEAILLVDDNPALRDAGRRHLNALGYKVRAAASGPAALAVLRSGETFDLLFTDLVMPEGMTGYELAEAAGQLQPGLKCCSLRAIRATCHSAPAGVRLRWICSSSPTAGRSLRKGSVRLWMAGRRGPARAGMSAKLQFAKPAPACHLRRTVARPVRQTCASPHPAAQPDCDHRGSGLRDPIQRRSRVVDHPTLLRQREALDDLAIGGVELFNLNPAVGCELRGWICCRSQPLRAAQAGARRSGGSSWRPFR